MDAVYLGRCSWVMALGMVEDVEAFRQPLGRAYPENRS